MTRVIHTGDTHIGYQQYHSAARRQDFLEAFETVVRDAVSLEVDAVVHAGDLFHDRRPDLRDILGTLSALRELDDAGIPFLAVVGNHEATRGGQWLDLFERLGLARRLGPSPTVVGETAFYGLDHVPRSRREDLEYDFDPHDADFAALVSHGLFTPFAHADWDTETVLDRSSVAFDAMLLGDNHAPDTAQVDGTWVTYCGSTERASASERDARGYNIVEFDEGVDIRRRSLETRPFVFVSVALGPGEGGERVREQVRQHDLSDAVVVVEITGEGDPVTPASVEELALENGALVARVTDRRELETASTVEVSFADPDAAVRDRVTDLGLSSAALDVDETVRDDAVADSNVRETVRRRVADRLEEGLDAFEGVPPEEQSADSDDRAAAPDAADDEASVTDDADEAPAPADTAAGSDGEPADSDPADSGVAVASGDDAVPEDGGEGDAEAETDGDTETDDDAETAGEPEADGDAETDDDAETDGDTETDGDAETAGEPEADDADRSANPSRKSTDGQVSMEDFL
jgi:DNA repair exonuclease SbcCD nuclease subunit